LRTNNRERLQTFRMLTSVWTAVHSTRKTMKRSQSTAPRDTVDPLLDFQASNSWQAKRNIRSAHHKWESDPEKQMNHCGKFLLATALDPANGQITNARFRAVSQRTCRCSRFCIILQLHTNGMFRNFT
jgi:hypothetical protein